MLWPVTFGICILGIIFCCAPLFLLPDSNHFLSKFSEIRGFYLPQYCGIFICIPSTCDLILDIFAEISVQQSGTWKPYGFADVIMQQSEKCYRAAIICSLLIPNLLLIQECYGNLKEIYIEYAQIIVIFSIMYYYHCNFQFSNYINIYCNHLAFVIASVLSSFSFFVDAQFQIVFRIVSFILISLCLVNISSSTVSIKSFPKLNITASKEMNSSQTFVYNGYTISMIILLLGNCLANFVWIFDNDKENLFMFLASLDNFCVLLILLLEGREIRRNAALIQVYKMVFYALNRNP